MPTALWLYDFFHLYIIRRSEDAKMHGEASVFGTALNCFGSGSGLRAISDLGHVLIHVCRSTWTSWPTERLKNSLVQWLIAQADCSVKKGSRVLPVNHQNESMWWPCHFLLGGKRCGLHLRWPTYAKELNPFCPGVKKFIYVPGTWETWELGQACFQFWKTAWHQRYPMINQC